MSLYTNLVAYWKLDEPAGSARVDSANGYNLTDTVTVNRGTGILGGDCVFDGSTKYLDRASNADLKLTSSMSFQAWVKLSSKAADGTVFAKWATAGNNYEYILQYIHSTDRFTFTFSVTGAGGGNGSLPATSFGSPSTGTWYHITCGLTVGTGGWICVDAGTQDTYADIVGLTVNGTSNFVVGRNEDGNIQYWNGEIDAVAAWKGRTLTAGDISSLYNGGAGLELYPTPSAGALLCAM